MTKGMRDFKVLSQANMSAVGKDLENMANMQGAVACEMGVNFHDNPYRQGSETKYDWLYSAWEFGFCHSAEFLSE
jgi:hypothetical protein